MADARKAEPLDAIEICDRLDGLRYFVECAYLAAGSRSLNPTDGNGLQAVLDHAMTGMRELAEEIKPSEEAEPAGSEEVEA